MFFSKPDKPEAVPLLNNLFVGSRNNPIRRILPLGNSLFVFKEQEGIYRITGRSPAEFSVELFDSSARILAADSAAIVNNQIWLLSDQGIISVTETGVSVISRPIEEKILTQTGTALSALKKLSFGVGYETERKYILWTVTNAGDTSATQAFVWNTFTRAFTRWDIQASTAEVNPNDDKLYIGDGASNYTLQERKTLDYTDYVDHSVSITIDSISGKSITLTDASSVSVGDVLFQSSSVNSVVTAINGNIVTVADTLSGWSTGSATVLKSFKSSIEYAAVTGANPGTAKQFPEVSVLFRQARFNSATLSFATDVSGGFDGVTISGNRTGVWGLFPWGGSGWGGTATAIPIRTYVPVEKQRGSLLRIKLTVMEGYSPWKLNGVSVPFRETGSYKIAR